MSVSDAASQASPNREAAGPRTDDAAPAFALPDTFGGVTRLYDFRQRQPVLLTFLHEPRCPACRAWLAALARRRARLDELGAAVVVVMPEPIAELRTLTMELDLPFRLLADEKGGVAARYGLSSERATVAAFALNRYGHVLHAWHAADAASLPPMDAPLDLIAFAEMEDCGCGLPAWPPELMRTREETGENE